MKRIMFALLVGGMVFGGVFGLAASLGVTGGTIQAGGDIDLVCDEDGVDVLGWGLEDDDGLVYNVRIGNIDSDCVSNDLFVNITEGGLKISEGNAHIAGGTVTVPLTPPVAASRITDIAVFIEGDVDG